MVSCFPLWQFLVEETALQRLWGLGKQGPFRDRKEAIWLKPL